MLPLAGKSVWVMALIQIAISTAFMLAFRFPPVMIVIFATVILIATAFSKQLKRRPAQATIPQQPVSNPVLFRILSIGIALCSLAFVGILLFGFVIFMNSWSRWQQYQGASHHETDFLVTRVYYQTHTRGGPDVFASGTVDGKKEWMNLVPYLHSFPHDQFDLDSRVPVGTSIPIYLFPTLKGRARVQVVGGVPPAEANHRTAMAAVNYGLVGLALAAGIIFVLVRLRRACLEKSDVTFATT
jgi:hypothetical protein